MSSFKHDQPKVVLPSLPCVIELRASRAHLEVKANRTHPWRVAALITIEHDVLPAIRADAAAAPQVPSLARGILDCLDEAKAEDILAIDLEGKTSIADLMVIATGRSTTHVNAIADRVLRSCKQQGVQIRIEGLPQCDWVLLDAGDIIVHVFRPEVRQFYNLEKMWGVDRPSERRTG